MTVVKSDSDRGDEMPKVTGFRLSTRNCGDCLFLD